MNLIHIHLSVSVKEDVISSLSRTCDKELYKTWALSIQRKLRFEISEIPHAQWNNTLRLHKLDPSHRTFGYYSSKQVTKERYWVQQFCQMERDISVRPNEMISDRSKWTTFKAGPEYTVCTKPKWSVPCYVPTEISGILGLIKAPHESPTHEPTTSRTYFAPTSFPGFSHLEPIALCPIAKAIFSE